MRIFLFFCLLLLTSTELHADLRVMAINTEWLWTPHDHHVDGLKYNQGDMSIAAYAEELAFYVSIIKANEVQLVALSEIENAMVAEDLAKKLGSDWQAYFKQGRDTATGQDVAIVSNLEVIKGPVTDFGFPAGSLPGNARQKRLSKVLGVQFSYISGSHKHELAVVTAHFLSKRNDTKRKSQDRQRQANALTKTFEILDSPNSRLIVLGDFNDYADSATITILRDAGQLLSAEESFSNTINSHEKPIVRQHKYSVDHILYRNLELLDFQRIDLRSYSDHFAVYARFR